MTTSHEKVAVVTGASSGLGAAVARDLAARGYRVLAGVRRVEDGRDFAHPIEPVILDVTDAEHIASLAARVEDSGVSVLVNNAGFAANAPVETLPLELWRRSLEVNVLGPVALTQALLPSLIRSGGRVVNISSVGGKIAMPAFGAYSASKFALEAVSDSLRQEVEPFGVRVVVVEPGAMRTSMGARGTETATRLLAEMTAEQRSRYESTMQAFLRYAASFETSGLAPDVAARTVARAVTDARPRTRYTIGRDAAILTRLIRFVGDRTLDRMIASTLRGA